ncbi:MAG: WYL domain-containing protein [Rikenellaceae bacterium]
MDQPKIERLLRLMKMLTANTTYSVDELAERLGSSRRTIYRYIDTFREAGFVIKREGDCIRLDKDSPHFKDITQLMHFSQEEALIIRRSIESIDDTNMLKAELKRKLYSVYDSGTLSVGRVSGRNSSNIHRLLEAIESRQRVVLRGYGSSHGSVVRDRWVEPFAFTQGYVQIWCYDLEDGRNKLFKSSRITDVELTGEAWSSEAEHREGFIDIFRMNGLEPLAVKLEMGLLARNLLVEEYPLSERDLSQMDNGRWLLTTQVASYVGVGRFVLGLMEDINIVESEGLREYVRGYIERFSKKILENIEKS